MSMYFLCISVYSHILIYTTSVPDAPGGVGAPEIGCREGCVPSNAMPPARVASALSQASLHPAQLTMNQESDPENILMPSLSE